MNTYTIRTLTSIDTMLIKRAGEFLATYDQRTGLTRDNSLDGSWDLKQAAVLAEQLRNALEVIERLTRPAAAPEPVDWAGRTFGQLSPDEKRRAAKQAADQLAAELTANADAISAVLSEDIEPAAAARACRTCGFTDCPGAQTGNCPRWPARDDAEGWRWVAPDVDGRLVELAQPSSGTKVTGTGWPA